MYLDYHIILDFSFVSISWERRCLMLCCPSSDYFYIYIIRLSERTCVFFTQSGKYYNI